jgi:hypothetical protein
VVTPVTMRSDMTEKKKRQKQKPASAGKKKPAAAGKRIFVKPPDLTRATEAELDEFAAWFFRQLCDEFDSQHDKEQE